MFIILHSHVPYYFCITQALLRERERERSCAPNEVTFRSIFRKILSTADIEIFPSSLLWIHRKFVKCRSLFLLWVWVHSTMDPQVMCRIENSTHSKNKAKNYYRCVQQQKKSMHSTQKKRKRGWRNTFLLGRDEEKLILFANWM